MSWEVYGRDYSTAEATGKTIIQPIDMGRDVIVKAFRTWIIVVGDPTFTEVSMRIYSHNSADGSAGKLLHTSSNTIAKASLLEVENHAVKECYFEFLSGANQDGIALRGGVDYNLNLNFVGASGWSSTSHCAWRKAWPDPVYSAASVGYNDLLVAPYMITSVIASTDI